MSYVRIMKDPHYIQENLYNDAGTFRKVLAFAQSKIGTNILAEGPSYWDVLESSPIDGMPVCKVLVSYGKLAIHFNSVLNNPYYSEPRAMTLNEGGVVAYTGVEINRIEVMEHKNDSNYTYYKIFEFAMDHKKPKGIGNNKYLVSLTLSDTYEIEIMGDSEENAKSQALELGIQHWNHVYDYQGELKNQKSQQHRYSIWHPDQVNVVKMV